MTEIFRMPDVGEGMHEGEIASWLVKVGDTIKEDDALAEVQNDKLLQEILSPYSGTVTKIFVDAGTVVEVGAPLVEFDGDGSGSSAGTIDEATTVSTPESPQLVEEKEEEEATVEASPEEPAKVTGQGAPVVDGKVRAMPSVRKLARQNNVDLTQVPATGRHGHVTLADVKNFMANGGAPVEEVATESDTVAPEASTTPVQEAAPLKEGRVPMTPIRKAIAKNMVNQKQSVPHVTLFDEVEVSKLMEHRANFKEIAAKDDVKLTYLAYVGKALAAMAKKYPELNAHVDMDKQEIVYPESINIGVAVDTPNGLFVPVVKNADSKSILAIAAEIADLANRAREGKLTPDVSTGSTITISNIGSARGNWFTPVINVNEAAILGLGTIAKEPVVNEEGELAVGNMMKLSLSFDHRLIDGMLAQNAMNYLKQLLADPSYMLMEV